MATHEACTSTEGFFETYGLNDLRRTEVLGQFQREVGDMRSLDGQEYEPGRMTDLSPWLQKLAQGSEHADTLASIDSFTLVEIRPKNTDSDPKLHDRYAVLMRTNNGDQAMMSIAHYGVAPGVKPTEGTPAHPLKDGPAWFGGCGMYKVDEASTSLLADSMRHSEKLGEAMQRKAFIAGVDSTMAGTKVIITGQSWAKNDAMQKATGALFSPEGLFPRDVTGSDARQNGPLIVNMEAGSALGGGVGNIVGTEKGIPDTAIYARYSIEHTLDAMREQYGSEKVPEVTGSTIGIQGLGKIGLTAAECMLEKGGSIVFTDILFWENGRELTKSFMGDEEFAAAKAQLEANFAGLVARYGCDRVKYVEDIFAVDEMDILCPCSYQEGAIGMAEVVKLKQMGVKLILSGANLPLRNNAGESLQEVVDALVENDILMPPDSLSNCGSATAAAKEVEAIIGIQTNQYHDMEYYINEVLIPHIKANAYEKMAMLVELSRRRGIPLYLTDRYLFEESRVLS